MNFSVFYCCFSDDATSVTSGRLEHEESTKTEFNMQYSITPVNHLRMSADVAKLPGYVYFVSIRPEHGRCLAVYLKYVAVTPRFLLFLALLNKHRVHYFVER